ncbi:matrix metalloproteinase-18-like [Diabrotica undecimpunctata]|uniref:matrix metalloproteinase-18-like n=1 Tax=Diabrotica undecimpunctata TaxID=50387 RepID=UPI003B6423A4
MMVGSLLSLLLLCFIVTTAESFSESDAKSFLLRYGYTDKNSQVDFRTTLINFQEEYNLLVDGKLNEETKSLMQKPRCQTGENLFSSTQRKWNKTNLTWYFPQGRLKPELITLTERAFNMWQDVSNLHFTRVLIADPAPDITITVVPKSHTYRAICMGREKCPHNFDGPGYVLAHANFPTGTDSCIEIHLDIEENWGYDLNVTDDSQTNLFMVIVHEIGHSLGLAHSNVPDSIMYPWYQNKIMNLSQDDINGMENLYGVKRKFVKIPKTFNNTTSSLPSSSSFKTTPPPSSSSFKTTRLTKPHLETTRPTRFNEKFINLCEVEYPDLVFLAYNPEFKHYRVYIASDGLLWKTDLIDRKVPYAPETLTEYLPRGISNIAHVFQNRIGDLIVISGKRMCDVSFPSLHILTDIPLLQLPYKVIRKGKTYIWYNGDSFIEFDEVKEKVVSRGRLEDVFPGVPRDINSSFRYIDGNIYFLKGNTYYKYNEFTRNVVKTGPFNWNILGIPCPDGSLVKQLKLLLSKVSSFFS